MNIIFVSRKHGKARMMRMRRRWLFGGGSFLLSLLSITFYYGYQAAGERTFDRTEEFVQLWEQDLADKKDQVGELRSRSDDQLRQLSVRIAELHARLIRLDALGEHLTKTAKLGAGEFDFSRTPAVGGPSSNDDVAYQPPPFMQSIDQLAREIELREQELEVLNALLGNQDFESDRYISGRPIRKGWLSSRFGRRADPFTGKLAWHEGIDFAGKDGSEVIAVAAGVVTWAEPRFGYGNLVEVNHGGEFSTRYAHAKKITVKLGDVVEKGQVIALMGSSGRSTGPHVHFEILKNGRPVDPYRYVRRK